MFLMKAFYQILNLLSECADICKNTFFNKQGWLYMTQPNFVKYFTYYFPLAETKTTFQSHTWILKHDGVVKCIFK